MDLIFERYNLSTVFLLKNFFWYEFSFFFFLKKKKLELGYYGLIMIIVGMFGGLITSIILENVEDSRKYIDRFIKFLMGISMLALVIKKIL